MKTINKKDLRNDVSCLKINNKLIYYDEIIHPNNFKELYLKEKPIFEFSSKIILGYRPFITFLAKDRKNLFNKNDILLIRILKGDKEIQFISKIYEWGKIHIPIKFTNLLNIKNHEKINSLVISKNQKLDIKGNIDLYGINEIIIPRENNHITIYAKRKRPITLPRFIKITSELLELFYLIHGDGHYQDKLYFINKTPELHEFVLEQFENIFRIPKNLWRARILISDLNYKDYAKNYWKNKLNLDKGQFYNISKTRLNTDKKGNLRIIIDKTIVSSIFRFIFNQLKLDKENSLYALNGLLYAEGGAQISKNGLHKITLSFNKKEKSMFKEILDNLNLRYTIEQNRNFIIQGWNNQYLFFKTFLSKNITPFRIHNQRRNNAINGFLSHSFIKTRIKYLSVLKQNQNINLQEFSKLLKIREDSILDTIRKKQYSQFININGKGINRNPFIISITNEGNYFLNMISKMEGK